MDKLTSFLGVIAVFGIAAWSLPAIADPATDDNLDPLYVFCYGNSSCADNGTITSTAPSNPLQFGFYISPGPNTGDFFVDVLIPNNEDATPDSISFGITGTQGGVANKASFSGMASLFSAKAWKGGGLATYLGITVVPNAPTDGFTKWLPSTQAYDPGATGYYVYQADLGANKLQALKKELLGPLLALDQVLPEGALVAAYLETSNGAITTDRSGALLMDSPVPLAEPGTLAIFSVALLSLAVASRRKGARVFIRHP